MGNELSTFTLEPRSLAEAMEYAKIIASSDMVPKDYINKPGNVLVAVQTGAELGLKPMQSLQGIAVINGRPTIWGDAQWALVAGHPDFEYSKDDLTDTKATVWLKRRNQPEIMRSFSIDDAKKAGLAGKSGPWSTNPKRMMHRRARAFASRDLFPDALKGIKSVEEVRDYGPECQTEIDITPKSETKAEIKGPEFLTSEKFEANKEAWRKLIDTKKKTVDTLIAFLDSKAPLTESQKSEIKSWEVMPVQTEVVDDFNAGLDSYVPE